MVQITGGCLCGSVRYRSANPPDRSTLCHCSTCISCARLSDGGAEGIPIHHQLSRGVPFLSIGGADVLLEMRDAVDLLARGLAGRDCAYNQ